MKPGNIAISQPDKSELKIPGIVDLQERRGNLETVHGIYISLNLSRELMIWGDWLKSIMQQFTLTHQI